jgi:hypothetical protein
MEGRNAGTDEETRKELSFVASAADRDRHPRADANNCARQRRSSEHRFKRSRHAWLESEQYDKVRSPSRAPARYHA